MKQIFLLTTTLLLSISAYCSDPTTINFCNNSSNTIDMADLLNCNELTVNNTIYSIQSLKLGFEENGNFHQTTLNGNIIPQTLLNDIQTYSPDKIYIEDIILVDSNNQEKSLKSVIIKITN